MTDSTASEAARLLGRIKTDKKAASSRENGKLGGRPPNSTPHLEVRPLLIPLNRLAQPQPAPKFLQLDERQARDVIARSLGGVPAMLPGQLLELANDIRNDGGVLTADHRAKWAAFFGESAE